jgi:cytosine/adenosine deaminase-related metal-dependent hydrolase
VSARWITGGLCLLPDGAGFCAQERDLEIVDGRIKRIETPARRMGEVIDARGLLVMPGLVNAHTHSPDNLFRGTAPQLPLELWSLSSAVGREGRSPREIQVSALLGVIEMLRGGTTTVLDHIRFTPNLDPAGLAALAEAYRDSGVRVVIAPVVADRPVIETLPLEPDERPSSLDYGAKPLMPAGEQVALVEAFVRAWHGREPRLVAAIGPSGPQRCSDQLLELAGDLARRHAILFHSHVLETRAQQAMAAKLYGSSMVDHLARLGVLGPRTNLVHLVWADDDDLDRVAGSGASVIHNPVSNARLGSGVCRLPAMLARGIQVGLGTDSVLCNDSNDLLETAKWTALLHRLHARDPASWIAPATALALATRGGAHALGLGAVTGSIAIGMAADLALYDLRAPVFVPLNDPVGQLVQGGVRLAPRMTIVAGAIVMRDGRCLTIDEAALWAEAGELAARRLRDNAGIYDAAARLAEPIRRMYRRLGVIE